MPRVSIVHITATLAFLGACSTGAHQTAATLDQTPADARRSIRQEVRTTRDTGQGPRACHPGNVGHLVVDFFGAVNRGKPNRVTDFFTPQLGWYSVTEGDPRAGGRHFVAHEPAELRRYFRERVGKHEHLLLLEIDVDYERAGNLGHVAYDLRRTADDLATYAVEAGGKGAIDCATGRIAIWSMAQRPEPLLTGGLCPGEPTPPDVAIACART